MSVLSVRNLSKRYDTFELKDVSFEVKQGEIMGFIGRNGAGKTTTLKSLLNMVHPGGGEICFFGEQFENAEFDIKRRIGFVSGGADYYTKKKIVDISSVTKRFYPNWSEEAYARYMKVFALDEHKMPSQLSAGMKVKYALVLAMSHQAEFLILDEPTSGLDPVSRDDLLDVFLELAREGTSILFSTHITSDLDKCADSITYIKQGRIMASENMRNYLSRYSALALSEEQLTQDILPKLIGLKRAKAGYTALALKQDAEAMGIGGTPADLETVMVHMEKEEC